MTQFNYTNHSVFHKNKSMLIVNPGILMIKNKAIMYKDLSVSWHFTLCSLVGDQEPVTSGKK